MTAFLLSAAQLWAEELRFFSVTRCRLVDTRPGSGSVHSGGGPLAHGVARIWQTTGACGVPATARAVSLNVTVVGSTSFGHVEVFPGDQAWSQTSTINFSGSQNLANQAIRNLSLNGRIGARAVLADAGSTHLLIDVNGYFSADSSPASGGSGPFGYAALRACRVFDTRRPGSTAVGHGEVRDFDVKGKCGVPESAAAAMSSVKIVSPSTGGHAVIFAGDELPGGTSTVNMWPTVPLVMSNGVLSRLGPSPGDGSAQFVGLSSSATSHVVLDTVGYFGPAAPLRFVPLNNGCRAVDTRQPLSATNPVSGALLNGTTAQVPLQACGLPARTRAVAVNLTVVGPTAAGLLIAHAADESRPDISTMSFNGGESAFANGTVVGVSAADPKTIAVYAAVGSGSTHVIVDVFGAFVDSGLILVTGETGSDGGVEAHPNNSRGYRPDAPFQFLDLDSVNLFNGNLVVDVPLGLRYPVGPGLAYGLSLVYNSNLWRVQSEFETEPSTGKLIEKRLAIPSPEFNAGLGWQVSTGRLYEPGSRVPFDERTIYVGPDGGEHPFFETLHVSCAAAAAPCDPEDPGDRAAGTNNLPIQKVQYTRDGSYLRLKRGLNDTSTVEFPNGDLHAFDAAGRLLSVRDRFGNGYDIAYTSGEQNCVAAGECWRITDTTGNRTHIVHFASHPSYPETVDWIELEGRGGKGVLRFLYDDVTMQRPEPDGLYPTVVVPVLRRVEFKLDHSAAPPQYFFAMEQYFGVDVPTPPSDDRRRSSGALARLRLPTGGKAAWTYQPYVFPTESSPRRQARRFSNGVATRSLLNQAGAVVGSWRYTTSLIDNRELINTVEDPLGHRTRNYFSVHASKTPLAANGQWTLHEYSLPLTHANHPVDPACAPGTSEPGSGYFLSQEVIPQGTTCPVRRAYVRYDRDTKDPNQSFEGYTSLNRRLAAQRTVYLDDLKAGSCGGFRCADVTYSDFDGVGHYRVTATGGNFESGNVLTKTRWFNPARGTYPGSYVPVGVNQPWVLETFAFDQVTDGAATTHTSLDFDTGTGFLRGKRTTASGGPQTGASDLVTTYTQGLGGFVSVEQHSGADTPKVYTIRHQYACGLRRTSRFDGSTSYTLDVDVDCASGLVIRSRDQALHETTYSHDALGRLTETKPPQEGKLVYQYRLPLDGSWVPPRVTTIRKNLAGVEIGKSERDFDALGRLAQGKRWRLGAWDLQETRYDAGGNVASVSTFGRAAPGSTKTTYGGYDAFGRPGSVTSPDGSVLGFTYRGVFATTRTQSIGRRLVAATIEQVPSSTVERYDRQGRLWQVTEPSEDAPRDNGNTVACYVVLGGDPTSLAECEVTTTYGYDQESRLVSVATGSQFGSQSRTFAYDARGFLASENHPEKTPNVVGLADVRRSSFDAFGNAGRVINGNHDTTWSFDFAGRPLNVDDGITGQPLERFVYDIAGRTVTADRYNYRPLGTKTMVAQLRQAYTYGGRGGRVDARTTSATIYPTDGSAPPKTNEIFDVGFVYDDAGRLASIAYPTCRFAEGQCTAATLPTGRAVPLGYTDGLLTKIGTFTNGAFIGQAQDLGITYHPSGMTYQVGHANGKVWSQQAASNGLGRPESISVSGSGVLGPYAYDGAGNIVRIGNETFLYDRVSRLWRALNVDTIASNEQRYEYDAFGNLQRVLSGQGRLSRQTPTNSATNRLTGADYDAAGNLLSWNGVTFTYDALGAVATVTTDAANGEHWLHVYDTSGERVFSMSPSKLTSNGLRPRRDRWTIRDLEGKVLTAFEAEHYAGWEAAEDYIYRDSQLLASRKRAVTPGQTPSGPMLVTHFHLDHLSTVRLRTDAAGTNLGYQSYMPFGEEISPSQSTQRMKFTGHERDLHAQVTDSDLGDTADDYDYMHARFYSPLTARFMSTDPIGGWPSAPQSWNRYSYVIGNPLNFLDPDGRLIVPSHRHIQGFRVLRRNASVTGQLSAGVGRSPSPAFRGRPLGGTVTVEGWPRPGHTTASPGYGMGIGASLTGNLATDPVSKPQFVFSATGGNGFGARVKITQSFTGERQWLVGLGIGIGWGATITSPVREASWTTVSVTDEQGQTASWVNWYPDSPSSDFSAITMNPFLRSLSPADQSVYDLFYSGVVCIESICM